MKFQTAQVGDLIQCCTFGGLMGLPHNAKATISELFHESGKIIGVKAFSDDGVTVIPVVYEEHFCLYSEKYAQTRESLADLLSKCSFKDWNIALRFDEERPYVQIQFKGKDNFGTEEEMQYGRKWMLSYHMCNTEVVRTVKKAIDAAMQHEVDEAFKYRGRSIFNPHRNVDSLWETAGSENSVDIRS
ncbi:MAG TPA: hypothetical protein VFM18_10855 [Methanosarcina sp.]|nr:hypothetical protein [Methanosarcina sp.]